MSSFSRKSPASVPSLTRAGSSFTEVSEVKMEVKNGSKLAWAYPSPLQPAATAVSEGVKGYGMRFFEFSRNEITSETELTPTLSLAPVVVPDVVIVLLLHARSLVATATVIEADIATADASDRAAIEDMSMCRYADDRGRRLNIVLFHKNILFLEFMTSLMS